MLLQLSGARSTCLSLSRSLTSHYTTPLKWFRAVLIVRRVAQQSRMWCSFALQQRQRQQRLRYGMRSARRAESDKRVNSFNKCNRAGQEEIKFQERARRSARLWHASPSPSPSTVARCTAERGERSRSRRARLPHLPLPQPQHQICVCGSARGSWPGRDRADELMMHRAAG